MKILNKMFKYTLIYLTVSSLLFSQNSKEPVPTITLHAEETKLSKVLSVITEMSGYNIVTGPSVSAEDNITIHMVDVNVEQAINLVVRAAGLSYEIVGNSILVANQSKLSEDVGVSPHIVPLKYSKAEDIASFLYIMSASVNNNI